MSDKYVASFVGADGVGRRLVVSDEDYQGVAKEITLTALTLDEDNTEDVFEPVRVWSGSFSFLAEGVTMADLVPTRAQSMPVVIYRGSDVEWSGYVKGESLSQQYDSRGEQLSVGVCSRLAVGGGINYAETKSCNESNLLTLGELLYDCLMQCGFSAEDKIWLCDSVLITAEADSPWRLFASTVDRYRFYTKNTDSTVALKYVTDDVKTIISEILRPFCYTVHERGGDLYITCLDDCTAYFGITIDTLKRITETAAIEAEMVGSEAVELSNSDLYTTEQTSDYYRGSKKYRVTLDLGKQEIDLFSEALTNMDGYEYDSEEERTFGNGGDRYKIKYFKPINKKGDARCYPYVKGDPRFEPKDDLSGWQSGSRAGCTPIRFIQVKDSTQPTTEPYVIVPQVQDENSWTDGFIVNPVASETVADAYNLRGYPLMRVRSHKAYQVFGGRFVLNMSFKHYCEGDKAPTNPSLNGCFFADRFSIGNDMYWGCVKHYSSHDYNGWRSDGDELVAKCRLYAVGSVKDSAVPVLTTSATTCGVGPTDWSGLKYLAKGCGADFGTQVWRKGFIEWEFEIASIVASNYDGGVSRPYFITLGAVAKNTVGIIITDVSLKYESVSYNERGEQYKDKSTREYYKLSTKDFDGDEIKHTCVFGSYGPEAGMALSNMFYDSLPVVYVYNNYTGQMRIEERHVAMMQLYRDRVMEVRTLVVKDDGKKAVETGGCVFIGDEEWLILAVSLDYLRGTRKITITKKMS